MTNQELYTRVRRHLLTQNAKSLNEVGKCMYRGDHGRRCAIGCLIANVNYLPQLETHSTTAVCVRVAAQLSEAQTFDSLSLASQLQMVHDSLPVVGWPRALDIIAQQFALQVEA